MKPQIDTDFHRLSKKEKYLFYLYLSVLICG